MHEYVNRLRERTRALQDERERGFTLIELLVVMIIIGILAAIAIPVFLSQKDKAKDTSAKSDVNTISKNVQAFYVDGTGTLSVAGPAGGNWSLTSGTAPNTSVFASGKLSGTNSATGNVVNGDNWCVVVTSGSTGSNKLYSVSADKGYKANAGCTTASPNGTAGTSN